MQKEVSYFDVSCWTRLAEVCGKSLLRGRGVRAVGRLKQDRWTDADGKKHSHISIVAEHVEFKPQFKKQDGDGKDGEEKPQEAPAEEQGQEEGELKEASFFFPYGAFSLPSSRTKAPATGKRLATRRGIVSSSLLKAKPLPASGNPIPGPASCSPTITTRSSSTTPPIARGSDGGSPCP
jgi:single-stranded DNA-binding protein